MTASNGTLPHWDMGVIYPGLESPQFETDFSQLKRNVDALTRLFNEQELNRLDSSVVDQSTVKLFDTVVERFNSLLEETQTLRGYINSFVVTDSRNDLALAKLSELQPLMAQISLLDTRLTAWIGSLDIEALIARSTVAADHEYPLRRARLEAKHLMSPVEEDLAAELSLSGMRSWQQLHGSLTSQLQVEIEIDGKLQKMALTAAQNLVHQPDRDLRERAYHAVNEALAEIAVPLSASLNAIKRETLTLSHRRGWDSPLEMALFDNAVDRTTLEAMMDAARDAFPDFQRYLKARARAMGLPVLAWYDQWAPLGQGKIQWSYEDAVQFIQVQFGTYSDKMRQLAARAFDENWIDAEPRDGKRGGAFCMSLRRDESRILANFDSGFASVGTLAHELGHAYHNLNLNGRTPMQRGTPMTLAETASTFCQKIVENAALKTAGKTDQIIIIDGLLEYAGRVILGVSSNFMFEERLFDQRLQREMSIDELCQLDIETQRATRGDAIDPDLLHPYRWAYVPHYYSATFYNFPYMFGLLFGLGLYAQYQSDADTFRTGYDDLLASTGMGDAAELAGRFGIDIRSSAFWHSSLDVLRADIDRFEQLIDE